MTAAITMVNTTTMTRTIPTMARSIQTIVTASTTMRTSTTLASRATSIRAIITATTTTTTTMASRSTAGSRRTNLTATATASTTRRPSTTTTTAANSTIAASTCLDSARQQLMVQPTPTLMRTCRHPLTLHPPLAAGSGQQRLLVGMTTTAHPPRHSVFTPLVGTVTTNCKLIRAQSTSRDSPWPMHHLYLAAALSLASSMRHHTLLTPTRGRTRQSIRRIRRRCRCPQHTHHLLYRRLERRPGSRLGRWRRTDRRLPWDQDTCRRWISQASSMRHLCRCPCLQRRTRQRIRRIRQRPRDQNRLS